MTQADPEAGGAAGGGEPPASERLAERRRRHIQRGKLYRGGVVALGVLITLAGVVMVVAPGPAFVLIPVGLGLLALEFAWAERLLGRALDYAERQKRKAAQATRTQKVLSAVAVAVAIAAFVAAALLWDLPVLPV